ncbi:MAG: hypothetical protein ACJA0S_000232 [Rickettsiales bacterium]|jgi:hypothetical protein
MSQSLKLKIKNDEDEVKKRWGLDMEMTLDFK